MLFALYMLTSCNFGNKSKLPKPPFETSIDLAREGVVADFDIRVTKYDIYNFEIRFMYLGEDRSEREYVRKLVGGLHEPTLVPTPVKLTIYKKHVQNEQVFYQITIKDSETSSFSYDYFAKTIGYCDLPRGEYRFVLESLAQPQEYASVPTLFHIGTEPKLVFIPINIDRSKSCPQ